MEIGGDKLNYLDVILIRNQDRIEFNWYHKPMFSGRYLNFLSHHPISQKRSTVYGLVDRCFLLSHLKYHPENLNFLIQILLENDYPLKFIFDNINNRLKSLIYKQTIKQKPIQSNIPNKKPSWFTMPVVPSIFEKFTQFSSSEIRVSFFSLNKLNQFIKVHHTKIP